MRDRSHTPFPGAGTPGAHLLRSPSPLGSVPIPDRSELNSPCTLIQHTYMNSIQTGSQRPTQLVCTVGLWASSWEARISPDRQAAYLRPGRHISINHLTQATAWAQALFGCTITQQPDVHGAPTEPKCGLCRPSSTAAHYSQPPLPTPVQPVVHYPPPRHTAPAPALLLTCQYPKSSSARSCCASVAPSAVHFHTPKPAVSVPAHLRPFLAAFLLPADGGGGGTPAPAAGLREAMKKERPLAPGSRGVPAPAWSWG